MPTIRHAEAHDAPQIAHLYRQLVNNPAMDVRADRVAALANDRNTALFVCEYRGAVRGSALVSLCADVMFGAQPFAVVENVVVDAAVRGQGLGAALLHHVEAFCLSHDCSKIMLMSSQEREHAHRFFERAGFVGSRKRGFVKYRREFQAGV